MAKVKQGSEPHLSQHPVSLTRLMGSLFISSTGRNAFYVGTVWIILDRTSSPAAVSWVLLTSSVATFLSSGILGQLADTVDKQRLTLLLDTARASILILAGLFEFLGAGLWVVYPTVGLYAIADRGYLIAAQAMIPRLARDSRVDRVTNINSNFYLMMQAGNFVGALAVVVLLRHMPPGAVQFAIAAMFGVSAWLLATNRYQAFTYAGPDLPSVSRRLNILPLQLLARPELHGIAAFYCAASAVGILVNVLLAGFVAIELKGDVILFGQIEAAWALGAVLACLALCFERGAFLIRAWPSAMLLLLGLGLTALRALPPPLVSIAVFVSLGALYNLCRVKADVLLQRRVGEASIGGAKGAIEAAFAGFGLSVYLTIGLTVDVTSGSFMFVGYGLALTIVAITGILLSLMRPCAQRADGAEQE